MQHSTNHPGGIGKVIHPPDDTSIELAQYVKSRAEHELNQAFVNYRVIGYKTQIVAGTNYFIKVQTDTPSQNICIHLKVWVQPWNHIKQLSGVQGNHTLNDPIEYF